MRVFVTGASGWIGSHTTDELLAHGHEVVGLARSDASAAALREKGAAVHRGDLDDLDGLRRAAEAAEAVVHLGFKHDFSDVASAWRTERAVAETLLETLAGSDRPFLIASGVAFGVPGHTLTEDDPATNVGPDSPRGGSEALALEYAERGVRSVALRFAPTVHGTGDHGFVARLVEIARERGVAGYIGDGDNRWPAVHVADAARLNRLALEQASPGTVVHAVAEEGIPARDIAAGIGAHLGIEVVSVAPEDADAHFGWIGRFFGMDAPTSSRLTRERFGWEPTGPTLLEDLATGAYAR
jgi:nucleoside-diphosphate-sugar epimerase